MDKRNALRAGAVSAVATLMMLMSSPAFALIRDDGDEPGGGLSVGETVGLYVVIPIVAFLVIAGLVMLPSITGKKKS
ncbi:hypothetical protein [Peterkaempfera bronchialis]|uniref:Secreted protein n=1 Tax=Peterkaempfera bronchialis TaxID=2126346 RepID=A0A345SV41_9ACTN|nr:hypothetical protein [Peterkaempfera bronchialis]AXI77596.1 hypothetical protein C7M71_009220 [Peterkaempfera bronchialis]